MTEAEWKQVENSLKNVYSNGCDLIIDGFKVSLRLRQVSQFKNAIVVYINGEFRGKWITEDCEERRRFFCCKKKSVVKESDYKKFGITSKKAKTELFDKYAYNQYESAWNNFRKMKQHFINNNKSVELMEVDFTWT